MADNEDKKEVYLEADKEIPGQHYVCLSFLSPQKILKNKDLYFFQKFLVDYEVQYKIKATESFTMSQAVKLQTSVAKVQDALDNMMLKKDNLTVEDLSGALATVKEVRGGLVSGTSADLEAHVKAEMKDFKESTIQDAYETFLFKNKKKLEDEFFAANDFRTTVQGLKVRGVYDTYNEAVGRAKNLQKLDPAFNVYVGQVGFWLPWDPEPHDVADQEYADDHLNTLMKKYKENEQMRDEFYVKTKQERLAGAKVRSGDISVGPAQSASVEGGNDITPVNDMFSPGEDLAIRRRRELAEENKVQHA